MNNTENTNADAGSDEGRKCRAEQLTEEEEESALEQPMMRWKHNPSDPRCECIFPTIYAQFPYECDSCMRRLPA